jgi:hypothetical protein
MKNEVFVCKEKREKYKTLQENPTSLRHQSGALMNTFVIDLNFRNEILISIHFLNGEYEVDDISYKN